MLTIVDLHREDELSLRSMAEVVGALNLDGIKGESSDEKHKDGIDIEGFSYPIASPIVSPLATLSAN